VFKDHDDGDQVLQGLVNELLKENGMALVNGLIRACLFSLPSYMIPESADVLYELLVVNRPVSVLHFTFVSRSSDSQPYFRMLFSANSGILLGVGKVVNVIIKQVSSLVDS